MVPHRIRAGAPGVELKLRVDNPGRDRRVVVEQGGETVVTKKLPRADPAVMVHINVRREMGAGPPLVARVEEEGGRGEGAGGGEG